MSTWYLATSESFKWNVVQQWVVRGEVGGDEVVWEGMRCYGRG